MQKLLFLFLIFTLIWFQMQMRVGRGGVAEDKQMMEQINLQAKINHGLAERNNQMIMQVAGLKGSADSIEARSRTELNMIKDGETLVILPDDNIVVDGKK
jgi:cell division protein FtsB